MQAQKAYSAFTVKGVDNAKRTFKGWATTPAVDRVRDSVNPMGAKFKNPLVLLHGHDRNLPIGTVTFGKPTAKGIEFEAEIPRISEPATLKERVDTAWGEIVHGLVRAVSIGFSPLKYAHKDDGGIDFEEIEIFELSTVSVPALSEAVITSVKSMQGDPLPREAIDQIKAAESRTDGSVALIRSKTPGSIRLK